VKSPAIQRNDCQCRAAPVSSPRPIHPTGDIIDCEFFREKLGFSLVFSYYGKPPYYAQVGRDRGASQSKVRRATSNRVGGPPIGRKLVVGIYDRRYSGRDQAAVS